jgi:hypothetical protein
MLIRYLQVLRFGDSLVLSNYAFLFPFLPSWNLKNNLCYEYSVCGLLFVQK